MASRRGIFPVYLAPKEHKMAVITSLPLVAGVTGHVTIGDANAGDAPLANSTITWSVITGPITVTPDPAGGFFIDSPSPGTRAIKATYSSGPVTIVLPQLLVNVSAAVAPEYLSP